MSDIIIVTNSTGELSALVQPVAKKIAEKLPQARIILVITPCQFASGREIEVARKIPGIAEIILPEEYRRWVMRNNPPQGIKFAKKGVVLFLGGDLLHPILVARKLKYPALAYTMHHLQWAASYKKFLVPDQNTYTRFTKKAKGKLKIVGDLMVDGVFTEKSKEESLRFWKLDPKKPIVTYLPGSRKFQIDFMAPFFLRTAELVNKTLPETQYVFALSPYTARELISEATSKKNKDTKLFRKNLGAYGLIKQQETLFYLVSEGGTKILLAEGFPYDAMNIADLAVTIPGTNTAQLGALGVPTLSVFPLNRPQVFPVEGLSSLFARIPLLGILLKKIMIKLLDKSTKYFALPNMKAEREIAPELRGKLKPEDVAEKIIALLKDKEKRDQMKRELKEVMGKQGAAEKIVEEINEALS